MNSCLHTPSPQKPSFLELRLSAHTRGGDLKKKRGIYPPPPASSLYLGTEDDLVAGIEAADTRGAPRGGPRLRPGTLGAALLPFFADDPLLSIWNPHFLSQGGFSTHDRADYKKRNWAAPGVCVPQPTVAWCATAANPRTAISRG